MISFAYAFSWSKISFSLRNKKFNSHQNSLSLIEVYCNYIGAAFTESKRKLREPEKTRESQRLNTAKTTFLSVVFSFLNLTPFTSLSLYCFICSIGRCTFTHLCRKKVQVALPICLYNSLAKKMEFSSSFTKIKHSSTGVDLSVLGNANPTSGHGVSFYIWKGLEVKTDKYHSITIKKPISNFAFSSVLFLYYSILFQMQQNCDI